MSNFIIISSDLICGSVAFVFVLLIILITVYIIKYRSVTSQPRVLACNGNGHINGKRTAVGAGKRRLDSHLDSEGQEMEVYVPMLTQIPPDFKSPPLDTKVRGVGADCKTVVYFYLFLFFHVCVYVRLLIPIVIT